jgi:hypothetical protein
MRTTPGAPQQFLVHAFSPVRRPQLSMRLGEVEARKRILAIGFEPFSEIRFSALQLGHQHAECLPRLLVARRPIRDPAQPTVQLILE